MGVNTPPVKGDLTAYPMNFKHIVEGMLKYEPEAIALFADVMFFRGSREHAKEFIGQIIAFKPTLVIGIDILFWFGYGTPPKDTVVSEYRLEKLEFALGLLGNIKAPLIIGDLPDMHSSVGHMLSERQVPSTSLLKKMNERIYAWASRRETVTVIPVYELSQNVMEDKGFTILDCTLPEGSKDRLVQKDMLHTTLEGTTMAGLLVIEALDIDCFETDPKVIMKKSAERARQ